MKINKTFGRVATTFLATAMLASVTAVPAFAEGDEAGVILPGDGATTISTISIDKTLQKPTNVYVPDTDFTFTVTAATATSGETVPGNGQATVAVKDGVDGGVKTDATNTGIASFEPNASDIGAPSVTEAATFTIDPSVFTTTGAGVYKYTVTETPSTYEGITNDTSLSRTLYVYVENPGQGEQGMQVVGAVLKGDTGKTDGFVNKYLTDGTTETPNQLTISKTVSGDLGDKYNQFAFELSVNGGPNEKYYVQFFKKAANGEWVLDTTKGDNATEGSGKTGATTVNSNDSDKTSFTLANDEKVVVYGLSLSDRYTVKEKDAGQDNYTTSATHTDETVSDASANISGTVADTLTTDIPNDTKNKEIAYTNNRDAISPTGLAMDIAPYALLVVVAAAGCFVFLRKRNED